MLEGANIVVLDCETRRSADDCPYCGKPELEHGIYKLCVSSGQPFQKTGWENHAALGLSIGCLFRYGDMQYIFFDQHTLPVVLEGLLWDNPLLVSWNGKHFDGPLMLACSAQTAQSMKQRWDDLWARSYDILDTMWQVRPEDKYVSGLNSLGAVSTANGYGTKEMDGATAPRLWRQGRHAEAINYCMGDVRKTRLLFEQIVKTGVILRGDGQPIVLPVPTWETLPLTARER